MTWFRDVRADSGGTDAKWALTFPRWEGPCWEPLRRFNRAGEFLYGCLLPGHFEAGMVGTIRVTEK